MTAGTGIAIMEVVEEMIMIVGTEMEIMEVVAVVEEIQIEDIDHIGQVKDQLVT